MSKDNVTIDDLTIGDLIGMLSYCRDTNSSKMMCKLKNGSEFSYELALDAFLNMCLLITNKHNNKSIEALNYLYNLSHNPDHEKSSELASILRDCKLLDNNNAMSEHVRNVVRSSISFNPEGRINIDSPILEISGDSQQIDV